MYLLYKEVTYWCLRETLKIALYLNHLLLGTQVFSNDIQINIKDSNDRFSKV